MKSKYPRYYKYILDFIYPACGDNGRRSHEEVRQGAVLGCRGSEDYRAGNRYQRLLRD